MIKYLVATGALLLAGIPAAVGMAGNTSFSREVPVRVPAQAQTPTPGDDDGTPDQGPGCCEPTDSPTDGPSGRPGGSGDEEHRGRGRNRKGGTSVPPAAGPQRPDPPVTGSNDPAAVKGGGGRA